MILPDKMFWQMCFWHGFMVYLCKLNPDSLLLHKELKDDVAERLNKTAQEMLGIENFVDMIADETVTTDCEELYAWLSERNHPVLGMEPLM